MMKAELVFVPAPGRGHLVSTVEFAKRLLNRDQRLSITVLVIRLPFGPVMDSSIGDSQIRFVYLPPVQPPPLDLISKSPEKYFSDLIESHKPHVRAAITDCVLSADRAGVSSNSVRLAGIVVDLFCSSMIDVANELGIPSYVFFTSGAAFLGLMLHLPTHHNQTGAEFNESDPDSIIPSYANPVPATALPSFVYNKDGYTSFLKHAMKFSETRGIIVNTFAELEPHALNSLLDGHAPPIYTAGPLLDLEGQKNLPRSDRDRIMNWLDGQPSLSVVLLCFGSMGTFDTTQLTEMAVGLERSGHRFLWSIRRRQPTMAVPEDVVDYEEVLPAGFLKRVDGRGMVCGWVPQVEVLAHEAVGGFVSHCGWNSILESLWFGVPVVTWPIYAEQQINAFEMVRELGLGVELRLDYRKQAHGDGGGDVDVVTAEDIERAVRCLMDGDNPVRKKVGEMAEKSRKAVADGGSSFTSIVRLVEDMLGNNP